MSTNSALRAPAAAPRQASPAAWASTSFSTVTGTAPKASCTRLWMPERTSVPAHPLSASVADRIRPLPACTTPAVPTPIPRTRPEASEVGPATWVIRAATASSTAAGPLRAGVGSWRTVPTPPPGSTGAAAIFVPPRSTPTTTSLTSGSGPSGQNLIDDRGDTRRRLAVQRFHGVGHSVGGDDAQMGHGRLERTHTGGVTGAPRVLEDDLEKGGEAVLLAAGPLPITVLGGAPEAGNTGGGRRRGGVGRTRGGRLVCARPGCFGTACEV